MSITCQICGTENPIEGEFCEGCGTELSLSKVFPTDQSTSDSAQQIAGPSESNSQDPFSQSSLQSQSQADTFSDGVEQVTESVPQMPSGPSNPLGPLQESSFGAETSSTPFSDSSLSDLEIPMSQSNLDSSTIDSFSEIAESSPQPDTQASTAFEVNEPPASYTPPESQPIPLGQTDTNLQHGQSVSEPNQTGASLSTSIKPAKLVITRFGSVTEESIPLQGTPLIVGKFDPATGPVDIDLTGIRGEEYISKQHAELYFDGKWKVRDIGSTNGVYIRPVGAKNYNPRLQTPTELNDSDEISFGNVRFVFREM